MKAAMPEAIPANMVIARMGLEEISARMELPDGTESYRVPDRDEPNTRRIGIRMIRPTDHLPGLVLGMNFEDFSDIPSSFHVRIALSSLPDLRSHTKSEQFAAISNQY